MSYFWFQRTGGEDAWLQGLSEHRAKLVADEKPAFVTVLDAHSSPEDGRGREEYAKMRFSGPLYFDWDAESLDDTIKPFQEFLKKLKELQVDLTSLRLYATGGRGFHLEIPEPIFNPKAGKSWTLHLPYIYKEVALELAVDTLDLRVYTGRKGRMWRVPGVKRSNGKYKVAITLEEALGMTPELYDQVCSTPRQELPRSSPELSALLCAMFVKAQDKVGNAVKSRGKAKADEALLARHNGDFPPTVKKLLSGEGLLLSAGFHPIAMQMAIVANALGKTSEELVVLAEGLIQNHKGDSTRYNSPRKRKDELRRMFEYTNDNPCYSYSRGGIRSICAPGLSTSDLDGVSESVGIGHVPESGDDADDMPEDVLDDVNSAHASLLEGMMILKDGIFRRTPEGARMVSNLSLRSPAKMIDTEDGLLVGIEAELVADSTIVLGRQLMDMSVFMSRSNLSKYFSGRSSIFSGSETQAGVVQLLLSRSAIKGNRVIYIVRKEGLDVIQNPMVKSVVDKDVIWACPSQVLSVPRGDDNNVTYAFKSKVSASPLYNSDIHNCKPLECTPESTAWLHALFDTNSEVVMAQMIGWFVSCFHKQFYQELYTQFPLLHPNGTAGAGKSLTTLSLARLFHLASPPLMLSCSHNATSSFTLKSAWTGSASIPMILDEYKPSELGHDRHNFLLQHFRLAYNQGAGASGGINRGGADTSFRDITQYTYSAPTVFMGESQEMQTAVVQRSLPVAFNPGDTIQHTDSFNKMQAGLDFMPHLGASLMRMSLQETLESRAAALDPVRLALRKGFDQSIHDRQVYNLAIVICGLEFLGKCLKVDFGDEFDADIQRLTSAVYQHKGEINVSAMSEPSKVLNDIGLISRTETYDSEFSIREGTEFIVGEGYVEILLREAFIKYFAWCKRKGFNPLYTSVEAFVSAMGKSPAVVDRTCFDSRLRTSQQSKIFRFSLEKLAAEGIEPFKSKSWI